MLNTYIPPWVGNTACFEDDDTINVASHGEANLREEHKLVKKKNISKILKLFLTCVLP
jgi:hypothetical protein